MIVSMHQPNYAPWLGYFYKISESNLFVFLDDVQFSRGGYTNRVRIMRSGKAVWLTQPIKRSFGTCISETEFSNNDWLQRHLDTLNGAYKGSRAFSDTWPVIKNIWKHAPCDSVSTSNIFIIEALTELLEINCRFILSSNVDTGDAKSDKRLVRILEKVAPKGSTYISGEGGAKYQSLNTFSLAGYKLSYSKYKHPKYDQGSDKFHEGLSVLDALFHAGIKSTKQFIRGL